jgi:hypothetical protein
MTQKQSALDNQLKAFEEARRERCWDPASRWKVLQDTITWADAKVGRNTKESRLEEQRRKLAWLQSRS